MTDAVSLMPQVIVSIYCAQVHCCDLDRSTDEHSPGWGIPVYGPHGDKNDDKVVQYSSRDGDLCGFMPAY